MITRLLEKQVRQAANQMPAVAIMGPRQSGKTTLVQNAFADYQYISLENPDLQAYAQQDPRGFLKQYPGQVILDEIQKVPELFSYLQQVLDEADVAGQYILTGSHHFLLLQGITQSLAGRVALYTLLPLSFQELSSIQALPTSANTLLFKGCYPRLYEKHLDPNLWYPNYITTYLERDVRQVLNISNLAQFQRFLQLCAGRCGQLLNYSELANDCGMAVNTVKSWLSILEASFIIYRLQPHHKNFNKRLIKSPKLYFYDTGLACSLLGIEHEDQLNSHYLRGGLFENMIIAELLKYCYNQGKRSNLYFWRDRSGHEVDCLQELAEQLVPIEIKSSQTFHPSLLSGLQYYRQLTDMQTAYLVYGGDQAYTIHGIRVMPWYDLLNLAYY